MTITLDDIRSAALRIDGAIARTPTVHSATLSAITGAEVWVKLENLQFTASFKERGAANKLMQLDPAAARAGVIAMSAGNHAQAVAYHARRLGIAATIVMPRFTPFVKVANTRHLGARVVMEGDSLAESGAHAHELAARDGLVFVHPYDDDAVIAGQGTLGLEMLAEAPELDMLILPIGGGGLIAGVAIAYGALAPSVDIWGVEAAGYGAAAQRLAGQPVSVGGPTIAEGIAVRDIGERPFAIIRERLEGVVLAPEAAIERAIIMLIEVEKTVAEGAGAAGLAALLNDPGRFKGRRVGIVVSGGNIDTRMLASILMRGLARDGRLVRIAVDVADQPGALAQLTRRIAEQGGNIIEVQHQRLFGAFSVKSTEIDLLVEAQDRAHAQRMIDAIVADGVAVRSSLGA